MLKEHFTALLKVSKKNYIANHLTNFSHNTSFYNNLHIIYIANNDHELIIKESLNILQENPNLDDINDLESSIN